MQSGGKYGAPGRPGWLRCWARLPRGWLRLPLLLMAALRLTLFPLAAQDPADHPEPPGKSDQATPPDRGDKPDKPEPPAAPEKPSSPEKPAAGDKPEQAEPRDDHGDKPKPPAKSDTTDKPERPDKPSAADTVKADTAAGAEASAKPGVAGGDSADLARLYEEAIAARNAGKPKQAVEKLSTLLKLKPDSAESWWALGWIEDQQAHEKEAMTAWAKAARLLPKEDPRQAEAAQRAARIEKALRPRPTPPVYHPIEQRWTFLLPTGPSLVLGLLFLAGVAGLALSRVREDWRHGPGSPQAVLVRLCERLRAGDAAVASELVRRAGAGDLHGLAPGDVGLLLSAAAAQDATARQALAHLLSTGQGPARLWAARALASQSEQPDPGVWVPLLQSPEPELRQCALTALAHRAVPQALLPLQALAATAGPEAPTAAAVLAGLDGAAAGLVALLSGAARADVRALAGATLAQRDPLPGTVAAALATLATDPAQPGRTGLVGLLARCGAPAAEVLLDLLCDPEAAVREAARDELLVRPTLRPLPPEAADRLAAWCRRGAPTLTPELLCVATETVPAAAGSLVTAALESEQWALRDAAVEHVTACGGDEAATPLLRALERLPRARTLDAAQQHHLALVCAGLRGCRVVAALPELLQRAAAQPDDPLPWATARTLSETGTAGPVLAAAAASEQPAVRRLAIALLAEHPYPEAAEAVWAELGRGDEETLAPAARILGRLRDKRAVEPLRARRAEVDVARQGELADVLDVALARLGDAAAARRVEAMLARETWPERRPAADYYRDLRQTPPRARAVVAEADAHARAEALLQAEERGAAEKLAALGEPVKPSLFDWFMAGWHRREVGRALALLGDADATVAAAHLDRIDELWGQPDAEEALAQLAASGLDWVRRYLKRKRQQA